MPWLTYSRSPAEMVLLRQMREMLDPKGIPNPGKVFWPRSARPVPGGVVAQIGRDLIGHRFHQIDQPVHARLAHVIGGRGQRNRGDDPSRGIAQRRGHAADRGLILAQIEGKPPRR